VSDFVFTLFTDDPVLAHAADAAGVDRIGVDLEQLNKAQRQAGTNSRLSGHRMESLALLRPMLHRAQLFARCNPLHEGTAREVEALLDHGVAVIMLPYFKAARELAQFCRIVDRRCLVVGLAETVEALDAIGELLRIPGLDEIHFGLNDLRLQMGLASHFDVLGTERFQKAASAVRGAAIPFGIAALARPDDRSLPRDPREVCRQVVTLGATRALVARSFFGQNYDLGRLGADLAQLRRTIRSFAAEAALPATAVLPQ
jgi:citrate lyase beta subunit